MFLTRVSTAVTACLLVVALAGHARAQAVDPKPAQPLPDSTYLALTLELPIAATFQSVTTDLRSRSNRQTVRLYRLSQVEVAGCELQWRRTTHRDVSGSVRTAREIVDLTVPLKEVAWRTLRVSAAKGMERSEPPVYEVGAYATNRSSSPFTVIDVESGVRTRPSSFVVHVRDAESAHRLARLLKEAAQRCDSWNTAPLRPIR